MNHKVKKSNYTFIDLFAGIGGFHIAFHNVGAKCVFACEINPHARKTYQHNFEKMQPELFTSSTTDEQCRFAKDITGIDKEDIPDFDILTAGFPCQPFSQAGLKKGLNDTRGTLFYDIVEILKVKQPKAYFLENVRHLYKHDNGKTFETIKKIITEELGYSMFHTIVKASDHGLPQHRPRLFMIGFNDKKIPFQFPDKRGLKYTMSDIFNGASVNKEIGYTLRVGGRGSGITDRRNWDSYIVDGKVTQITPKEGKRMQGFPADFEFPVSDNQAMKQLGNSVAIPAIQDYAEKIIEVLDNA
ncbi:MAG: DNA cytosine methyltransferase [Chitinophagales bacterium]|nr:DNA cytosine methyltransferase [Chitinophagales bacterium]